MIDQWYYLLAGIALIIGAFANYISSREQTLENNSRSREEKLNLRIDMLTEMQVKYSDNCIKGLDDIKDTLKEIKIQINNHTAANTALSIEVERIKSNMDGVIGKVDQMERMFEAVITNSKNPTSSTVQS